MKGLKGPGLVLICIVALMLMLLTGCNQTQEPAPVAEPPANAEPAPAAAEPAAAEPESLPLEGKHYTLAINATFAPFESVEVDASGKTIFVGLDIELTEKLAEKLGFTYEFLDMEFNGLMGSLTSGHCDFIISGLGDTPARKEQADFSTHYYFPRTGILCKIGDNYTSIYDLEGKNIAVSLSTIYQNVAETVPNANVMALNSTTIAAQELLSGRANACFFDSTQARKFAEENADKLEYHIVPLEETPMLQGYAICFPKGSELAPVFNAALAEMKTDGTINELIKKYMGELYMVDWTVMD